MGKRKDHGVILTRRRDYTYEGDRQVIVARGRYGALAFYNDEWRTKYRNGYKRLSAVLDLMGESTTVITHDELRAILKCTRIGAV